MRSYFPLAVVLLTLLISRVVDASAPLPHGSVSRFTSYALEHSPLIRRADAQLRASEFQSQAAGRLPNPTLSYGVFLRRIETRVGSQRQRFGLSQAIPWPSVLSQQIEASRSTVRSRRASRRALLIEVRRRTEQAYWEVWGLQQDIEIQRAHLPVVRGMLRAVEAHLQVGRSTLADHGRIAITLTRLQDRIETMRQRLVRRKASLAATVGSDVSSPIEISATPPEILSLVDTLAVLRRKAMSHPRFVALGWEVEAKGHQVSEARAMRYPSLVVGVDYIDTAPSGKDVPDDGKDAIVLKLGVQLPLWQGSYRASVDQRRAERAAVLAQIAQLRQVTWSSLVEHVSRVRESVRRIDLLLTTLIPQAESVFRSGTVAYQTGAATISDVLLSWRQLLTLQSELVWVKAEHARAWSNLRALVGGPIRSRPHPVTTRSATSTSDSPPTLSHE